MVLLTEVDRRQKVTPTGVVKIGSAEIQGTHNMRVFQ